MYKILSPHFIRDKSRSRGCNHKPLRSGRRRVWSCKIIIVNCSSDYINSVLKLLHQVKVGCKGSGLGFTRRFP